MYRQFFGLQKQPFSMTPDPSFLLLTAPHREALAGLTYALLARKGFVVLTGDAGTGKTTLLSRMLESLPASETMFSMVFNPTLTPDEFLELVLVDFGMAEIPTSKAQRLIKLQYFLLGAHSLGKTAVLVVDEAHKLPPDVLEEIRLLSNFELAQEKLLQIVLAGQNEMAEVLNSNELRQLKQRVAVRLAIRPLSVTEVSQYIAHRWSKAGASQPLPFQAEAIDWIARWSQGIPRLVNSICDNALTLAYAESVRSISKEHILEVAKDLDLLDSGSPAFKAGLVEKPVLQLTAQSAPAPRNGWAQPVSLPSLERYVEDTSKPSLVLRWMEKLGWRTKQVVI